MSGKRRAQDTLDAPDAKRSSQEDSAPTSETSLVDVPSPALPQERRNQRPPEGNRSRDIPEGILTHLASPYQAPYPMHDEVQVVLTTTNYTGYFTSLYQTLIHLLYPDFDPPVATMITEQHFVYVCRYLMKARADYVASKVLGLRFERRIPMPTQVAIPNALALLINGIGVVTIDGGALTVVPIPEPVTVDVNLNLSNVITHQMIDEFTRLIIAVRNRGLIRTTFLSNVVNGTAYWLLSARDSVNRTVIAGQNANHCKIFAVFKEWTPSDALLASVALNQYNGLFGGITQLKWTTDESRSIAGIRATFNADA